MRINILWAVCIVLLSSCRVSEQVRIDVVRYDKGDSTVLCLQQEQPFVIPSSGVRVVFKKVLEDSRCPKGVQCLWEGVGIVELELISKSGETSLDTLATLDNTTRGYKDAIDFAGTRIKLEGLTPYPTSSSGTEQIIDYRLLISSVK